MSRASARRICTVVLGMLAGASVQVQASAPTPTPTPSVPPGQALPAGQALPTGGTVVSGQVTTSKTNNTLTIDQSSQNAILNWQSFSIGSGNTVKVIQPNSSSALLDRVTGNTPSLIAGQLDANGEVLLINPNGIAISNSGVIDVGGGFVASTLGLSDQDFKDGKFNFSGNGASAGVNNSGTITVGRGGYAALLGGTVKNAGLIAVPLGKVGLGSGEAATLDVSGDGFLQVAVPTSVNGQAALIQSSGMIDAQGGNVIMSAATARSAARNAINLSGVVQANSISGHEGSITLSGGTGGAVAVSGTLDVSGKAGSQDSPLHAPAPASGGSISVTGENIALTGASLDASGASGGTIRIGGDEHGSGTLQQADTVSVDANTIIKADALGTSSTRTTASGNGNGNGNGNGGSVVLWSTEQTNFLGKISATGALGGGNGGDAEVSSKNLLNYAGSTNLSAPHGSFGDLLLDPYNITIETASGETNGTLGGGSFTPSGSNSILSVADLQSALGTANVTVATGGSSSQGSDAGNITVANALSWSSGSTLTLNAYNAIAVNAAISLVGGGLSLTTTSTTNGALTVSAPITVSGAGSVTISVPNLTYTSGYGSVSTPNMAFTNGGSLQFTGSSGGVAQGSLNINSHAYTLLNSLAQIDGIDSSAAGSGNGYSITHLGSGMSGYYALATDVTAPSGVSYTASLVGSSSSAFTGVFEGLGNTISNLSINSSSGGDVALFAYLNGSSAAVRDLGVINGSVTNTSSTPATGSLIAYNDNGLAFQDYSTSSVTGNSYNSVGGLIGTSSGFVISSYATGAVSGDGATGGLVGHSSLSGGQIYGEILNSYATGKVTSINNGMGYVGGLVGSNEIPLKNSYATGAVYAPGNSYVGGLVGDDNYDSGTGVSASISNAYATGAVYGGTDVGGLVGKNQQGATISNAYSTGVVVGTTTVGGFVGENDAGNSITNGYWDNVNSGIPSTGIASGTSSGATGVSTTNLQSSANPSSVALGSAFGGGAMAANGGTTGVYPYLIALDPNGVQAISGFAYKNAAGTALTSGSSGAGQVSVLIGSTQQGTVSTGANGYYYLAVPAGTISSSGSPLLAYTVTNSNTGAANGATLASATGTTSGFNVYGSELRYTTADTTFSSATSDLSAAETTAAGAATALTSSFFSGLAPYITATGASFTLDQTLNPSTSFSVQTTATNAPITVSAPFTLSGSNTLTLNSSGALAINAPITVSGAGSVALAYNTSSPTNLTFALGSSINYGATNNGGTLNINGQAYTLLYKLTDSANATGNGPDSGTDDIAGIDHAGDGGYYALATSLTGTGSASAAQFSRPLAGSGSNSFGGVFEGLGNTITNLTINDSADEFVGLFGTIAHGTVRDLGLVGGSVTGTNENGGNPYSASGAEVGALAGMNGNGSGGTTSWVVNDYASTAVSAPGGSIGGGLVGINNGYNANATIINSFATGAVTATGGQSDVGGLAGYNFANNGTGLITQSYAMGPVYSAGGSSNVGGLFGVNNGGNATVTDSYASGAVSVSSGSSRPGGIVGYGGGNTGTLYWDTSTSGQSNASGAGGATATGYTTAQLQSNSTTGVTLTGFSGGAAGGQNGVYPYLSSFFPNGVQAVSGYAYNGVGNTPLASSATGAVQVSLNVGGVSEGSASTGANGYYYLALPASTLPTSSATAIAYATAPSSAQDGATLGTMSLSTATGAVAGPNIYGGYLNFATSATTYSAASPAFASAQSAVNAVAGTGFSSSLAPYIDATGASFTVDQSPGTNGLAVQTTASNAPITVAAPITVSGSNSLLLNSSGALTINAPITVSGAGNVVLDYNTASPNNLSFALGSSINYGATNNGGTLSINGQPYTLLYKLTDSANATGNGPDSGTDDIAGIDNAGDGGYYALATSLTGTGSASAAQFSHPLAGSGSNSFGGVFEGLGNTISNLTIDDASDASVGLFGTNKGTVRDLGLIGGIVSGGTAAEYIGGIAGANSNAAGGTAWIVNSFNTGNVSAPGALAQAYVGGIAGINGGTNGTAAITNSYATGAITGSNDAVVGGLVGTNQGFNGTATISNSYATGAVDGGANAQAAGGLVGSNAVLSGAALLSNVYATGAVSAGTGSSVGGVAGTNGGTISDAYWNSTTSGQSSGVGLQAGTGAGTGLTTAALQSTATQNVSLGAAFSGGAAGGQNGVYPYLASFFPGGVQALSGYAYTGTSTTPLASGTTGAVQVSVNVAGVSEGSATTGANGYYYLALPASTLPTSPATAIAYATAPNSALDGATLSTASLSTATGAVAGPNIYGGYLNFPTSATTYSAASPVFASAQSAVNAVAGTGFSSGLSPYFNATGAGFTIDEALNVSSNLAVQTAANSPLNVSAPITLSGNNALTLNSGGTLVIDAPITVTGAGSVALSYNTASPLNLSFAQGDGLQFTGGSAGAPQGSLAINGVSYTLINSMAQLDAIDGYNAATLTSESPVISAGLTGKYALATPLNAAGTYGTALVGTYSSGNASTEFTGIFEGLGNTVTGLTIVKNGSQVGLFGSVGAGGLVRDLGLIGGSVSGTYSIGDLVGENSGSLIESYATGSATSSTGQFYVGGLVGYQFAAGTIEDSYATGVVSNAAQLGGLVGQNNGSISTSYATGAVISASNYQDVGGLVGANDNGTIAHSYATGAVTGSAAFNDHDGLVGVNYASVSQSYWDTTTSGTTTGIGGGTSTSGATGLTTTALQSTSTGSVNLTSAFAGGAAGTSCGGTSGEYPYLTNFFPNGVQTISGTAYKDAGVTPLASTAAGAGLVTVTVGGVLEGTPSTGVNGYYYLALPPATISSSGSTLLAYTAANQTTGAVNGAAVAAATGSIANFNIYGGNTRFTTSATTYSTADSGLATVDSYGTTPSWVATLTPFIIATGPSFTIDEALNLNSSFGVQTTTSGAPITVADPITLAGANVLNLNSAGALAIDAPISVTGAGNVALSYNTASPTNLSFALGDSINYGATNNGATLSINGQPYTLLYKLTDSANATGNGTDSGTDDIAGIDHNTAAGGDSGYYALATSVTGTGTASAAQFSHPLAGSGSNSFSGVFEGLGNTITNLTINDSADYAVGLFGTIAHGTMRDLGLIGGSVTGSNENGNNPYTGSGAVVGGLVGSNGNGTGGATSWVVNDYDTGTVSAGDGSYVGGLVGANWGYHSNSTIINSFATSAVSGGASAWVGGLVGFNLGNGGTGLITDAYATGAVSGGAGAPVGGLLGGNDPISAATVSNAYSTGAVNVGTNGDAGGFVGYGDTSGTTSNAYWDTSTSGLTNAAGVLGSNAVGYSTAQLQNTSTTGVSLGAAFSGGAAGGQTGVYPYLVSFFPNGVQSVSGVAYANGNGTVLASGTAGAGLVSIASSGAILGTSTTGDNGYYYLAVPAGTLPANQGLVGYTQTNVATGAQDGVTFAQSSGGSTAAAFSIYGGWQVDHTTTLTSLSTLESAYTAAVGSTAPANFTLPDFKVVTNGAFDIDQSVDVPGTIQISAGGAVSETSGATLTAANLLLSGGSADYVLTDDNQVGGLAASVSSLSLLDGISLGTTTLQGPAGATTSGITATGTVELLVTGSVTLGAAAPITGASPVIAANGAFVNDAGANAVTASSGRWLIYSSSPGADTFGSLNSANTAIFDATPFSLSPSNVTQSGNRYLFANQPVLNVTSTSDTKVYGIDDSASLANDYTVTGFPTGISGAFLTDTASTALSGAPSVTSAGSTAFASVAGGPYAITIAPGTLTSTDGYALNYVSNGSLSITPATITVSGAAGVNKTYDTTTALPSGATGYSLSGIYSNDTGNITVTATADAYASPNAGPENINISGLTLSGSAAGNYQLSSTTATGSGTISPAIISVSGATGVNKTYDGTTALPSGATGFNFSGVYASDASNLSVAAGTAAYAAATVGPENINVSGLTLSGTAAGNYVLSASNVTGSGTIVASSNGSGSGTGSGSGSGGSGGSGGGGGSAGGTGGGSNGGGNGGGSSGNGGGSTGGTGGATSGRIHLSPLTAGGASSYVLSGKSVNSSSSSRDTTVIGTLSNGTVTLTGTFVVHPRSSLVSGSLPDEIAANSSDIVTFVPGLTVQLNPDPATGLASTAAAAAFNETGEPFDIMPLVVPTLDDQTRPWEAINTFGNPGFDEVVICLGAQCAFVPRSAPRNFAPSLVVR